MAKQSIGEFLSTLRKANGYTQQEVADRLGISNRTLSGWECNNVLPDILLLPALAEMYGVTVDEILAGERIEKNEVALTNKSEKRILKNKLAKFSTQCSLLLGLIIIGIALSATCTVVDMMVTSMYDFLWWFSLLIGSVLATVSFAILLAFWKGAELFGEDTSDEYSSYCLILRKKIANCLYVIAAESAVATIVIAEVLIACNQFNDGGILACIAFGLVAVALFTTGWLLYKNAIMKWGGDQGRSSIRKGRRHFWAIGFWGTFPLVLSVILAIVLGCVQFGNKTTIYENSSVDEFVQHMETLEAFDNEYHFPLSDLAFGAKNNEKFDLGDGFVAVHNWIWGPSFTITNENIKIIQFVENGAVKLTYSLEAPGIFLIDENGVFLVYNLRYHYLTSNTTSNNAPDRYVEHDNYIVERVGDGMAFVHDISYDYSAIGYAVSSAVIVADLIVCAALCVARRNKFSVKL